MSERMYVDSLWIQLTKKFFLILRSKKLFKCNLVLTFIHFHIMQYL